MAGEDIKDSTPPSSDILEQYAVVAPLDKSEGQDGRELNEAEIYEKLEKLVLEEEKKEGKQEQSITPAKISDTLLPEEQWVDAWQSRLDALKVMYAI